MRTMRNAKHAIVTLHIVDCDASELKEACSQWTEGERHRREHWRLLCLGRTTSHQQSLGHPNLWVDVWPPHTSRIRRNSRFLIQTTHKNTHLQNPEKLKISDSYDSQNQADKSSNYSTSHYYGVAAECVTCRFHTLWSSHCGILMDHVAVASSGSEP